MERMRKEMEEMLQYVRENIAERTSAPARGALIRVPTGMMIRSSREKK